MRYKGLFWFLSVSGLLLIPHPSFATDTLPQIFLSEVQIAGTNETDEFIELYNSGGTPLDISGFQLRRKTAGGTESSLRVFEKDSVIPAHGYYLWANNSGIFSSIADTRSTSSPAKDNAIALYTRSGSGGVLLDSLAWGNGKAFSAETPILENPGNGKSLARDPDTLSWSLETRPTPTNSRGESFPLEAGDDSDGDIPPAVPADTIRLNELLPNPVTDEEENEFIELYNASDVPVDVSGWTLKDSSKGKGYTLPLGSVIGGGSFLALFRTAFGFALNNSNESVFLLDQGGQEHDTASYEETKEGVSLNFLDGKWRGGTPTPGLENSLNSLPETKEKVPEKGFRGVPVLFDARGADGNKDKLKYVWDFGDGHKSYKEKTTHTYDENGTYEVKLTVNDGKDDVVEIFSLKIRSYEAPKLRITALFPNPDGKDAENEWIRILNKEKKAVNLQGFSIATGSSSKKMTNHPIRENFTIAPGKEKLLTREDSLFTLPNQKGRVELRGPDKEMIDRVKYKEEKSIPENAIFQKNEKKEWEWEKEAVSEDDLPEKPKEESSLPAEEQVLGAVAPPITEEIARALQTLEQETVPEEEKVRYEKIRQLLAEDLSFVSVRETIPATPSVKGEKPSEETSSLWEAINSLLNAWISQQKNQGNLPGF